LKYIFFAWRPKLVFISQLLFTEPRVLKLENISRKLKAGLAAVTKNYRHILVFVLVLLSVFIIYWNDFGILANEALQNEAFSHVLLFPFFAGFLFYLKKDVVKASLALDKQRKRTSTKYVDEILGVALCLVAFLVYWYGSYTFYPLEYHMVSLPIFIMGVTLILLNSRALKMLIFPILFLLFLIPLPSTVLYTIGGTMANVNTQVSYATLKTVGLPVTLSSSYGSPTILLSTAAENPVIFAVDIPCSGIYSLIAFAMFAAFLAFVASTSILRKLSLFVLGFFVFAVLNIIRIIAIVSVGFWFGAETALLLHSFAGLVLIFIGMLLILVVSEKVLKIRIMTKPQEQPPCPKCKANVSKLASFCQNCGRFLGGATLSISKATFVKLLLLLLGCSIVVVSISAPTFATAQSSIELSSNGNLQNATSVFPEIHGYTLSFLYRDTDYENIAHQDASLMYGYFPVNTSSSVMYADIGVSSSLSNLHSWEVCFIAMQTSQGQYPLVNVRDSRDIQLLADPPLIGQYLVFDSPDNYTQVTLYWYEKATFKTGLTVEQKYVRISLIVLTQKSSDFSQLEKELLEAGQIIAREWEPLKSQALISLGVPAQQSLLVISIAFLVFTKTAQYFNEQRKTSNNLKIFDNFASPKEKIVLQTVLEMAKEKKYMETNDIVENVQKRTGETVNSKTLLKVLDTLEENGFIKRTVISVGNAPVLMWKV
jgi:exosortase